VWTYGNLSLDDEEVSGLLARFYHEIVGPYWPPERRHVEAGYRTLAFPYTELDPPAFPMEQDWMLAQVLGYVASWSATQRFRETEGRDPVEEFARELIPIWGDSASIRRVRWPLSLRVGRRPA
jgi:hypothetical protein